MDVVYAGTPEFAVPTLNALLDAGHRIPVVLTQPDRPAGRGRKLRSSPVKRVAIERGLQVEQPLSLREAGAQELLRQIAADVVVVVAYGLLLPKAVLGIPRLGCLNVHASLLPRWRGAAPIHRAILAGDRETGVSIMLMDSGLDTGPVLATARCRIEPGMTTGNLHDRLATLGAKLLVHALADYASGRIVPVSQPTQGVSYADKVDKREAVLDWTQPCRAVERQILGLNPWPVAQTRWRGQTLRVWRGHELAARLTLEPGQVLDEGPDGIDVTCGDGAIRITELQLPGKRPMTASEFLNGHSALGDTLG